MQHVEVMQNMAKGVGLAKNKASAIGPTCKAARVLLGQFELRDVSSAVGRREHEC